MSTETLRQRTDRFELYGLISEGLDDIKSGNTRLFSETMKEIRAKREGLVSDPLRGTNITKLI